MACCLPEASAQIAVQSINYNLATQGQVTAAADTFTDSVSGNIPGGTLVPSQTVQQDATGISDPNFSVPTLDGLTRLAVSDGGFGFSNPMRLSATSVANMYLFRDPTPASSALGSSGSGSYFNEVVFTLAVRSSVQLTGAASGIGGYYINGAIDPENGAEGVGGHLPALVGAFAPTGFASVRLLNASGGELYQRRTEAFATSSNSTVTLILDAGTYRIEQSGNSIFTSDPVPSAVNSAVAQPEAGYFQLDFGFRSELDVVATPVQEFVWQGGSSTGFNNPLNWQSQQVPGTGNLVEFSLSGIKTVELAPAQAVQTAGISAASGSQTSVNMNGGSWSLGGPLQVAGAKVNVSGGVMQASGPVHVSGNSAELVVTGTGAALNTTGAGMVSVSGPSSASLKIQNGATANWGDREIQVTATGTGQSFFSIQDANSRADGGRYIVGNRGLLSVAGAGAMLHTGARALDVLNGGEVVVLQGDLVSGPVIVDGGAFSLDQTAAMEATGDFTVKGSALAGVGSVDILNGSTLDVTGVLRIASLFEEEAEVLISGMDSLLIAESGCVIGVFGKGRLTVSGGAVASIGSTFVGLAGQENLASQVIVRGAGSRLQTSDLSILEGGRLIVEQGGELNVELGRTLTMLGIGLIESSSYVGNLRMDDGGSLTIVGNDTVVTAESAIVDDGELLIGQHSVLDTPTLTLNGGLVFGNGLITGHVINNIGSIHPGSSPGILTIDGDYSMSGGKIVLEIGGTIPGVTHDVLVITGNFNFTGGVIELVFSDGFAPQNGQTFELLDITGAVTGTPVVQVRGLEPGWQFEMVRDPVTDILKVNSLSNGVALPPLRISDFTLTAATSGPGKRILATLTGPPTESVVMERSNDLVKWTPVVSGALDGSGQTSFDVTDAGATGDRSFFRFIIP